MENKKILTIFLYEFKRGVRATAIGRNVNDVFESGNVNKCTVQLCFTRLNKQDSAKTAFEVFMTCRSSVLF